MRGTGESIGGWSLGRLLDKDPLVGPVFEATNPETARRARVRLIDLGPLPQPARDGVRRWAKTFIDVEHPNLLRLLDHREEDGTYYLASEAVDGGSLSALLEREGKNGLPVMQALGLAREMAEGLARAAEAGILHSYLVPSAVLLANGLNGRPVAKLAEVGLLRALRGDVGLAEDLPLRALHYAAPEQLAEQHMDERTDVYALGVVLYEALTGLVPFPAKDRDEAHNSHNQVPPPPPSKERPGLGREIEAVVLRCLEKHPENRYADAGAVAQALAGLLQPKPPPQPGPPDPPRLALHLAPDRLALKPGVPATLAVQLANTGPAAGRFGLEFEGAAAAWVVDAGGSGDMRLGPGEHAEVTVGLLAPRAPEVRAGEHRLAVKVRYLEGTREAGAGNVTCAVAPFSDLRLAVEPQTQRGWLRGSYRGTVTNAGNAWANVVIRAEGDGPSPTLRIDGGRSERIVGLEPGASHSFQLAAEAPLRMAGEPVEHRLPVEAATVGDPAPAQTTELRFVHQAVGTGWHVAVTVPAAAVAALLLLLLLVWPAPHTPAPNLPPAPTLAAPVIEAFDAQPSTIRPGETVTLSWSVRNATSIDISAADGSARHFPGPTGSTQDTPPATTTYTLIARGQGGTSTPSNPVTVQVEQALPPPTLHSPLEEGRGGASTTGSAPVIDSFLPDRFRIQRGETVELRWSVQYADSVSIPGINVVNQHDATGTVAVSPATTTHYTLIARGGRGSLRSVEIPIYVEEGRGGASTSSSPGTAKAEQPSPPPAELSIRSFTANGSSRLRIELGEIVTFAWTVENGEAISIRRLNSEGAIDLRGRTEVQDRPSHNAVYELIARGNGREKSAKVAVEVPAVQGQLILGQGKSVLIPIPGGEVIHDFEAPFDGTFVVKIAGGPPLGGLLRIYTYVGVVRLNDMRNLGRQNGAMPFPFSGRQGEHFSIFIGTGSVPPRQPMGEGQFLIGIAPG